MAQMISSIYLKQNRQRGERTAVVQNKQIFMFFSTDYDQPPSAYLIIPDRDDSYQQLVHDPRTVVFLDLLSSLSAP